MKRVRNPPSFGVNEADGLSLVNVDGVVEVTTGAVTTDSLGSAVTPIMAGGGFTSGSGRVGGPEVETFTSLDETAGTRSLWSATVVSLGPVAESRR